MNTAAMTRLREQMHDAVRDEIKATAWRQIAHGGAATLSLRAVAGAMGLTAPALYRYYGDRDALVTALIVDAFTSFASLLEAARDALPPDDHAQRLQAVCLAYRRWASTYPQRYILIFGTPIAGYAMPTEAEAASQRSFLVLADVIGAAHQAGRLNLASAYQTLPPGLQARYDALNQMGLPHPPVVIQLALSTWSRMHGLTSLELYGYLPSFLGGQVEDYIDLEVAAFLHQLGLR
jgi:AcrR family transcriptional regulator